LKLVCQNRGERAEQHRQDRDEPDHLLPLREQVAERPDQHSDEQRNRRDLGAAAKNAVTGLGAPS